MPRRDDMETDGFGMVHFGIGLSGGPSSLKLLRAILSSLAFSNIIENFVLHDAIAFGEIAVNSCFPEGGSPIGLKVLVLPGGSD